MTRENTKKELARIISDPGQCSELHTRWVFACALKLLMDESEKLPLDLNLVMPEPEEVLTAGDSQDAPFFGPK